MDTMTSLQDVEYMEKKYGKDDPATQLLRNSYSGAKHIKEQRERRVYGNTTNRPVRAKDKPDGK